MAKTANEIALEIKEYILSWRKPYENWYSGITSDPRKRLFDEHGVVEEGSGHGWILRQCLNSEAARQVEEYLISTLGTKGDVGGGDTSSNYVYAYEITNYTRE